MTCQSSRRALEPVGKKIQPFVHIENEILGQQVHVPFLPHAQLESSGKRNVSRSDESNTP